ncbi:MAG TPA: DUF6266 family protein [Puia sp.]|jgi:hypothetical protein|nr:DUF6266 family protein [Puia sp.]
MGKISNGILGGFSGTIGPAVGSSWKGIQVIRSRPPRKRGSSSPGQLSQMAKMSVISGFLQPLTGLLNRTYNGVTVRMSCFNKSLSYNIRNAIAGDYPTFTINYEQVILGRGDLLNVLMPKAGSLSKGTITFSWADNSGVGSARATDQAFVAVYCEAENDWVTKDEGSQRNAGSYTLDVTEFSGKAVHGYIGFLSADSRFVSTSLYTGLVNIL